MSSVSDPLQQNLPPVAVARRVSVLRMLLSDVGACIALALVVLAVLGAAFAPCCRRPIPTATISPIRSSRPASSACSEPTGRAAA